MNELGIPFEKINLILPARNSKYSDIYNVYNDLYLGLKKINVESEIIMVRTDYNFAEFPYFKIQVINLDELKDLILSNLREFYLTVDDFNILKYLFDNKIKSKNLLIWSHYFYGHKFIFSRYKLLWKENFKIPLKVKLLDLVPNILLRNNARFYVEPLKNNRTIAQSLWTDLLLERVYNIFTNGILYIPVENNYYNVNNIEKNHNALIFLGEEEDTDLIGLKRTINLFKQLDPKINFDYFGNEKLGDYFGKKYGEPIRYLGKIERKDLSIEYAKHFITIAPIYNGNFEMVPIESLLCGTPVISYIQPFMEVTGISPLIANINNIGEIKSKFKYWNKNIENEINHMKDKILNVMDNKKIAENLINYLL